MANVILATNLEKIIKLVEKHDCDVTLNEKQITTGLIAKLIAYDLPLPSAQVNPPVEQWYVENCVDTVAKLVNEVNESVLVEVDQIQRLVRGIWRSRYNAVYDSGSKESFVKLLNLLACENLNVSETYSKVFATLKEIEGHHSSELLFLCNNVKEQL